MKQFETLIQITIKPHGPVFPIVEFGERKIELTKITTFDFHVTGDKGPNQISLGFYNKTDDTPDMAVEIQDVIIEGMDLDRFKWANKYYPRYPEPWASEQTETLPKFQTSAMYLGWNGLWVLEFELPIFTWIHKLENLGWIYN